MKFALNLDLQDGHDQPLTLIVSSLRQVAATVQSHGILFEQTRAIADHNGVTRGEWAITEDAPGPLADPSNIGAFVEALATPKPQTIDCTPRGLQSPEGAARVACALNDWNHSAHDVANLVAQFLDAAGPYLSFPLEDFGEQYAELEKAVEDRAAKQEEFLRAVSGCPAAVPAARP